MYLLEQNFRCGDVGVQVFVYFKFQNIAIQLYIYMYM